MAVSGVRNTSAERQRLITELVQAQGFLRIDDLADRFQVTPMTIHRDLDRLDSEGLVRKVRSGVRAQPTEALERNARFRKNHMREQKSALARAALDWLDETGADVISLDDSTTVLELGRLLVERLPLTLITNFLPVINLYSTEPQARLIATAGEYVPAYESFVGQSVVDAVSALQSDVYFMSATAVSQGNCYHPAEDAAAVKRAFMASAARKVLLFDHTKLSRRALHLQANLADFDAVIVDDGISADQERGLRDATSVLIVAQAVEADADSMAPSIDVRP